ncbi:MAG: hypothetical protein ACRDWW_06995 [Acidimicrobiales bacterium]
MNDDELVARLRDTLRSIANVVTPSAGLRLPPAGPGSSRLRHPLAGRPLALAASVAAAAAVAAAVVFGTTTGTGHHRTRVAVSGPAPTSTTPAHSPATASVASTAPPTTQAAPSQPVPAGFQPLWVTFVSPQKGWALGSVPCKTGGCASVAVTHDGATTWSAAPAPPITVGSGLRTITFADGLNGWIVDDPVGKPYASELWATHDGGYAWKRVPVPGGGSVVALAASERTAHAVVLDSTVPDFKIYTSPASSDSWTRAPVALNLGAGPVPQSDLVLQGSAGWLVDVNRTVVSGARLANGQWSSWTPPCSHDNGPALVAASPPSYLLAVCDEGMWGPPEQSPSGATFPSEWIYVSTDGGTTFSDGVELPASATSVGALSTPAPGTVVVGGASNGLVATFDGAKTWQTVYRAGPADYVTFLGFTTPTQGVAIVQQGQAGAAQSPGSVMLVTRDGGHHWAPVQF